MIIIYSEEITPRIEYITHLIFNDILQVETTCTSNSDEFLKSELPKINYSNRKYNDELYLKPHGLLSQNTLDKINVGPVKYKNETVFFESSADSVFPFDIFAASFYLVTRYEEYFETELDKYGRFPANQSTLFKNNLLKKPVVNIWANWLANEIKQKNPGYVFPERKFKFISTIDIDNAWAYLNKGFWRTGGALIKAFFKANFREVGKRISVLSGMEKDHYGTYNYLDLVFKGNEEKVKFFFLLGDYSEFDKNVSFKNRNFQKLIRELSSKYEVGIHPSFAGYINGKYGKIIEESRRLKMITGKEIQKSRQHYLNLKFPKTYNNLIKAGIAEDFTLGFADQPGFRAGICTPFSFYDLQNEKKTNLLLVPFQVMDGTLLHYLNLSPAQAFEEIKEIMTEVKNVGGTFVSIWHNETVNDKDEWKGYRDVFEKMNQLGFRWANE